MNMSFRIFEFHSMCHVHFFVLLTFATLAAQAQTRDDCLACHSDESLTTDRQGKQVSLHVDDAVFKATPPPKLPSIACPTGFGPGNPPHKDKSTPVNCVPCPPNAPPKHPF